MRTFRLYRKHDVSGVSGTGWVAEGVVLTGDIVVLHWLGKVSSVVIYADIDDMLAIHGHRGETEVRWDDQDAAVPTTNLSHTIALVQRLEGEARELGHANAALEQEVFQLHGELERRTGQVPPNPYHGAGQ